MIDRPEVTATLDGGATLGPVETALAALEPISSKWLREVVARVWWIELVLIPIDGLLFWKLDQQLFAERNVDWTRIALATSPHLFVALAVPFAYRLLERLPNKLKRLWDRGILRSGTIDPEADPAADIQFTLFIQDLGRRLNPRIGAAEWKTGQRRLQIALFGWFVAFFVVLFFIYFPAARYEWGFPFRVGQHLAWWMRAAVILDVVFQAGLVIVVGLMAARLRVLALEIKRLAKYFEFDLDVRDSFRSGGLQPIGDICLQTAVIWAIAATYSTGWLIWLVVGPLGHGDLLRWLAIYFSVLLGVTLGMSILTFFVPLYVVHKAMLSEHPRLEADLDKLSREASELASRIVEAFAKAESDPMTINTQKVDAMSQKLQTIQREYAVLDNIPSWPFDAKVVWKFVGSTVVPLTGVVGWLPALITKVVTGTPAKG